MLALSYGFIFVPFQAEQLVDYNRYIYSHYIGWFILALGCLSVALLPQITVKGGADGPTAVLLRPAASRAFVFELFVLALASGMPVPPEPADFAAAERAGLCGQRVHRPPRRACRGRAGVQLPGPR